METTALGDIEGYKHIHIKVEGKDLRKITNRFFTTLMSTIEGKKVIWRTTPTAVETEDGYKITARVHVYTDVKQVRIAGLSIDGSKLGSGII